MRVVDGIQERFSARIVYGEPIERSGIVTIPAARVIGGGGGGSDKEGDEGGGFGMFASPVGAWVIEDGRTTWKPAIDALPIVVGPTSPPCRTSSSGGGSSGLARRADAEHLGLVGGGRHALTPGHPDGSPDPFQADI